MTLVQSNVRAKNRISRSKEESKEKEAKNMKWKQCRSEGQSLAFVFTLSFFILMIKALQIWKWR